MAYYGILMIMCSLDPCQLYCVIGVVDMGPWGREFHADEKRAQAPVKKVGRTWQIRS